LPAANRQQLGNRVKFTRRQTLIVTTIASLVAAGVFLRAAPAWKIALDVPIVSAASLNVHRVQFKKGNTSFEAVIARMPRGGTKAKLIDLPEGGSLADIARQNGAMLAINGGYFDAAFQPVGLQRIDRRDTGTWLEQSPLSGVVTVDDAGAIDLVHRDRAAFDRAASAFQTGPFLIEPGGDDGIRSSDDKAAERTILATNATDVFIIITTPATLLDVADALSASPLLGGPTFDRALNLDGGPSSGFVIDAIGSQMQRPPRSRIRNAILFLPAN
jgi:exopolysaccharide biosynthesis protein